MLVSYNCQLMLRIGHTFCDTILDGREMFSIFFISMRGVTTCPSVPQHSVFVIPVYVKPKPTYSVAESKRLLTISKLLH